MLIQSEKVNKCKYSADSIKKQASTEKIFFKLNQFVIKFFEIGMDIANTNRDDFQVNM